MRGGRTVFEEVDELLVHHREQLLLAGVVLEQREHIVGQHVGVRVAERLELGEEPLLDRLRVLLWKQHRSRQGPRARAR